MYNVSSLYYGFILQIPSLQKKCYTLEQMKNDQMNISAAYVYTDQDTILVVV